MRGGARRATAGDALRAWLDAFNSGDTARVAAYARQFEPALDLGGEPGHLEFTVRERKSPMTGYGVLDVSAAEPRRVTARDIRAMGPNMTAAAVHVDAAARARAVAGAAALLDTFYVLPDAARRMRDSLRARLARGAYDGYANGVTRAMRLSDDLAEIAHDKHLRVMFSPRPLPPDPPRPADGTPPARSPEAVARERAWLDGINCGFVKAEQLPGNVGTAGAPRAWSRTSRRTCSTGARTSTTSTRARPARPGRSGRATACRGGASAARGRSTC